LIAEIGCVRGVVLVPAGVCKWPNAKARRDEIL
jgi:hypothetical protein